MKIENSDFFISSAILIQDLLDQNSSSLDSESVDAVQHYISHDEYEMAFEGLFIDLMILGKIKSNKNLSVYMELGKNLGLEQGSVFDGDFWLKLTEFIEQARS